MNYENQVVKHNYSLFIFKYKDKLALNREYLVPWNLRYTFIDFIRFLPWCVLPNMFIYIDGFSDNCIWRTGTDQHWSRLSIQETVIDFHSHFELRHCDQIYIESHLSGLTSYHGSSRQTSMIDFIQKRSGVNQYPFQIWTPYIFIYFV